MNTDLIAYILQAGVKSDFFLLREDVNKDPIAPYLFLLCRQILHYMIEVNIETKGMIIDSIEITITQFADDTTFVLDGSQSSLRMSWIRLKFLDLILD